jgi:hypothetical protein
MPGAPDAGEVHQARLGRRLLEPLEAATIDLRSTTTKLRDAIWTKYWISNAKHTVKIGVVGTSGRPTITTDGLAYLKGRSVHDRAREVGGSDGRRPPVVF